MTYAEKLKDPRWQRKRLEIMERDEWACVNCFAKNKTLHVHHDQYKGEPWDAPSHCLFTLCEDCHRSAHSGRVQLLASRIMPGGFMVKRTEGDGKFFLDRLYGNVFLMGTEWGEYEVREYPDNNTVTVLYPLNGKCRSLRHACQFARAYLKSVVAA